jgi:pimeloyl-ACP methyl ester carboxylesterase
MAQDNYAFLHGGGQGGWVWDETIEALRQQGGSAVNAVAFDLAGCGANRGEDTSALTVEQVATRFVEDLAASGMRDIVLVGHSNAGTIMPIVARQRPDLIRRYVYVSCIAPPPGTSIWEMRMAGHDLSADRQAMLDRLRGMFCNDMAPDYAEAFLAKLGFDAWPNLASLQERGWQYDHLAGLPSTYVFCLQDRAESLAEQEKAAALFRVERRVQIDAGHQAMNTRPHGLAEIVRMEARV